MYIERHVRRATYNTKDTYTCINARTIDDQFTKFPSKTLKQKKQKIFVIQ